MTDLAPVFYIPHGGGPMPLIDDLAHASLIRFLKALPQQLVRKPDAVVLISGHWESAQPSVYAGAQHPMLFDYYGFPPHTYEFKYPAAGAPELAKRIAAMLQEAKLSCVADTQRGFDHGAFVPMLLIDPEAKIPCIQLSLLKGLDPVAHVRLGLALQELRNENVLIIGSGMSFHNLQAIFAGDQPQLRAASDAFHEWLLQTLSSDQLDAQARLQALANWQRAPYATFCHPRAEHLLPLHVCAGIASGQAAKVVFNEPLMNHKVAGFSWQ